MVTVGGPSRTGVKSNTVVAPLLCNILRNMEGGKPAAVATNAFTQQLAPSSAEMDDRRAALVVSALCTNSHKDAGYI